MKLSFLFILFIFVLTVDNLHLFKKKKQWSEPRKSEIGSSNYLRITEEIINKKYKNKNKESIKKEKRQEQGPFNYLKIVEEKINEKLKDNGSIKIEKRQQWAEPIKSETKLLNHFKLIEKEINEGLKNIKNNESKKE